MALRKRKLTNRRTLVSEVADLIRTHEYTETVTIKARFRISWESDNSACITDVFNESVLVEDYLVKQSEAMKEFNRRIKAAVVFSNKLAKKEGVDKGLFFDSVLDDAEKKNRGATDE